MHPRGKGSTSGKRNWDPWLVVVWVLILAYVAFFVPLTILKHNAFQTTAFDLGNVDQTVWNTRHGRPFAMTNIEGLRNRLGTHVEPILLPISLLYVLWSDPRVLLLLQTAIIALGAWPVYLLAKRANGRWVDDGTGSKRSATYASALSVVFASVYLLFPSLQSANVFDFHAVALAPTFFLWAFYFLETERWGAYALFGLLTMSCKEDMPLLVVMLGFYALIVHRNWRVGLSTIGAAILWFFLAVGYVMPYFDPEGVAPLANRYAYLGDGPPEIVVSLFTRPGLVLERLLTAENLVYLRDLLAPVAYLSLLAPHVLALAAPTLLINLLGTDGFMHQLEGFHYGAPLVPIVVVSAAYGAAWLIRRLARPRHLPLLLGTIVLAATLLYHHGHGYTPLATSFWGRDPGVRAVGWPAVTEHHRVGEEIARSIPAEASLAAPPHPNPHASQRQQLTMIDRVENGLPAPLHDADYIWLDVTNSWPLHPNDLETAVRNLLAGDYGIEQAADGWLLLRRGARQKTLPEGFYSFAHALDPQPQYPMRLRFMMDGEPVLEALGFDLNRGPQPEIYSLTFYWQALQPLPPELRLYPFYFADASGQILEDTSQRPMVATVWYPPDQWQPGKTIKTSTLPWNIETDFSVGLGVVDGEEWDSPEKRLPIRVEASKQVVRLFDSDTWARLLKVEGGQPVEEDRVYAAPSPQYRLDVDLDGQIRLLGFDLDCAEREGVCDVHFFWQAQDRLDTSYVTFAQLLGPAGEVRAQVDAIPRDGGYPTNWWLPGEVVKDQITLELPQDTRRDVAYRLIVGMYDPASGARLAVSGSEIDYVELTTVEP